MFCKYLKNIATKTIRLCRKKYPGRFTLYTA